MARPTCRCFICHRKDGDSNRDRMSYVRVKLGRDEHGWYYGCKGKKHSRKIRRIRERRQWQQECWH